MADVVALVLADSADLWSDLGFVVEGEDCWVDGIRHQLGAPGRGVVAWMLEGADDLTELPVDTGGTARASHIPDHPNGVLTLDHIVVATPDLAKTIDAFESAGIGLRRTRATGTPQRPMTQAFFTLARTIVEVVGPTDRSGPGAVTFYGLAYTVADLDKTAEFLGARLRPASDAVQKGRRIATLDRAAGSTIPMAFMSARTSSARLSNSRPG